MMFRQIFLSCLLLFTLMPAHAQKSWFKLYTDSAALVQDGEKIKERFMLDLKKIKPDSRTNIKLIVRTTPYLTFFDGNYKTISLPMWEQLSPDFKHFFTSGIAVDETEGKKIFGLFFNGFYLAHELGHGWQYINEGDLIPGYSNEYFANEVAILWWRKQGRLKELMQCYDYARSILAVLKNPVPPGSSPENYFTQNYMQVVTDPYVYGYMQFRQFVKIYEDRSLPDFDTYVRRYLKKKQGK